MTETENDTRVLSASSITGTDVINHNGEDIGKIEEVMIDTRMGHIAYVVLSFGGIMGLGNKLFAIPWGAFMIHSENEKFVLNVAKEKLEEADGFDKDDWPDMADLKWRAGIYDYYGSKPYWD